MIATSAIKHILLSARLKEVKKETGKTAVGTGIERRALHGPPDRPESAESVVIANLLESLEPQGTTPRLMFSAGDSSLAPTVTATATNGFGAAA